MCSMTPRAASNRVALGESCSPAPASCSSGACSSAWTEKPLRANAIAAASPAMPAPATTIWRRRCTSIALIPLSASGSARRIEAASRLGLVCLQLWIVDIERRTIAADDLVAVAHVYVDVGMVQRRRGAHAFEFLDADFDLGMAGIVVEMRCRMSRHLCLSWTVRALSIADRTCERQPFSARHSAL